MTVTGPDFIALQVRDLDRASAFYQTPPGAAPGTSQPAPCVLGAMVLTITGFRRSRRG